MCTRGFLFVCLFVCLLFFLLRIFFLFFLFIFWFIKIGRVPTIYPTYPTTFPTFNPTPDAVVTVIGFNEFYTGFNVSDDDGIGITWNRAELYCNRYDRHLASIHSPTENDYAWSCISDIIINTGGGAWIGLNDVLNESYFEWSDATQFNYSNWYPSEPNNFGSGEDCAHFWSETPVWNDIGCDSTFTYFICNGNIFNYTNTPTMIPSISPSYVIMHLSKISIVEYK